MTAGGPAPLGDAFDDLMSAAVEEDGTLIASGHPDLSSERLRVEGKPPLLGLVESTDGATWVSRSLLGEADFHGLVAHGETIYGADSTSEQVLVSPDGGETWESRRGRAQLLDLAVDPTDADQMVGVDLDGGILRTSDGADSWSQEPRSPVEVIAVDWSDAGLVALTADGSIHVGQAGGDAWEQVGNVPGAVALTSLASDLYVYAEPDVYRSTDGGLTWQPLTFP